MPALVGDFNRDGERDSFFVTHLSSKDSLATWRLEMRLSGQPTVSLELEATGITVGEENSLFQLKVQRPGFQERYQFVEGPDSWPGTLSLAEASYYYTACEQRWVMAGYWNMEPSGELTINKYAPSDIAGEPAYNSSAPVDVPQLPENALAQFASYRQILLGIFLAEATKWCPARR